VESFLQELPVEALWGVGPVTAAKLRALGITRLVQVRAADRAQLRAAVGTLAETLEKLARGEDDRPVRAERMAKSASSENTYAQDLTDMESIRAEVGRMAAEMGEWLDRKDLAARNITLKVRYAGFITVTRSHTLSWPTREAQRIASWALVLLERTQAGDRPVRLLGVRVHGLVPGKLADASLPLTD
jgi:DNA polymerase IV